MPNIFDKLCEKILSVYIYLASYFGYEIAATNRASSFVVDENNVDIEIVEIIGVTEKTDPDNIIKYLRHHIMLTDDKFCPIFFNEPLVVRFKYRNETYKICLRQLKAKNTDHSISLKEPKYLSAIVKQHDDDEGVHVTDILVELHGPDRNFFSHIPDTVTDLSVLLDEHKGNKLHTFDMMGNQKVCDI